jgi:hypothetical protein
MISTTITLFGLPIVIRYEVHSPDILEWSLGRTAITKTLQSHEYALLEYMLRRHVNYKIECILRDEHQARVYEEDAKATARAEDMPF